MDRVAPEKQARYLSATHSHNATLKREVIMSLITQTDLKKLFYYSEGNLIRRIGGQIGKWRACIKLNGSTMHIGRFTDFSEAVLHRFAAEQCLGWEGCDSSSPAYQYVKTIIK